MEKLLYTTKKEGFDISFSWEYEQSSIYDCFDETEEQFQKMLRNLESGIDYHVVIRVTASKEGVELGNDYLGSVYDSCHPEEMIKQGLHGYLDDMINSAVSEAKDNLTNLISKSKEVA